ncbi:MAG: AmmeMemoRadiSam system protein B [Gammaproteobacteria bacterium]|nr:AmmeMemoRadiSam system protein B [Gammaproteobacteria bacterium]MDH5735727.1 AmmeMemoRadiSam system protein B [Gammaproteobacteria bacterium]
MNTTRLPAVAGLFYPEDRNQLQHDVHHYLSASKQTINIPKAIIVPHAGYIYSAPIAATAYINLLPAHSIIKKVVLLGPSHRVAFTGLASSSASDFSTPLGKIPVDQQTLNELLALPQVIVFDEAHAQEHSLEVQLPFLQIVLDDFQLIPLVVGDAGPDDVADVLEYLWGGPETLIVISSDLSHYHNYVTANQLDQATSTAIENLQPEKIHYEMACGRNPVNGLLKIAKHKGLHGQTLDLRNSGDTAGSKDRVVGYGAYAFI